MLSYVKLCCVNYINYLNKEYKKFIINIRIFFMLLCYINNRGGYNGYCDIEYKFFIFYFSKYIVFL